MPHSPSLFSAGSDFGDFTSSTAPTTVPPGQYQAVQQAQQYQQQQLQLCNAAFSLQQVNGPLLQQQHLAAAAAKDPFAL